MTSIATESIALLDQAGKAIEAEFRQAAATPARRASGLAQMVRTLWPSAGLSACLLREGGSAHATVQDQAGAARPELEGLLLKECAAGELPVVLKLAGQRLLAETLAVGEQVCGALAVAVPSDGPTIAEALVRSVLATCGRQVASRLALEARQRELDELRERLAEESSLATIGELAGPVVHEFNNLLNTMLLQVAVMEQKVDESILPDLRAIRRQGTSVTVLVKQWQQCRRRPLAAGQSVDVNRLTAGAAAIARRPGSDERPPLALELAPHLPPARGSEADFRRLVTFLLNSALLVSGSGPVIVRTEAAAGDKILLRVEDSGPAISPSALPRMFEPLGEGRPGSNRLELAACRTLVRRLQGKIHGENRPSGGVTVVVELPVERG